MSSNLADKPPPSTTAVVLATAILAGVIGYFLGAGSSIGLFGSRGGAKKSWPNSYDVTIHPDSSDEELMARLGRGGGSSSRREAGAESSDDEDVGGTGELSAFEGNDEECKLMLVVRTDLGMGKGQHSPPPGRSFAGRPR
jgi:peptidyl-tRNA hydrolase, PTH2 family